jgi:deoxyribonuclease-1
MVKYGQLIIGVLILVGYTELSAQAKGNLFSQSFYEVKRILADEVFYDNRKTIYCNADFSADKKIKLPQGFVLPDLQKADFYVYEISDEDLQTRATRMEWEHIVPAQNFGKTFKEWTKGHKNCISKKGKTYKGRKCAEQENRTFRYMYADMYNLYPSIGAVNYLRSNFNFTQFGINEKVSDTFGVCGMKISHNKVEPRAEIRGEIARVYLYMEYNYPHYRIGSPTKELMLRWNKQYPVSRTECKRAARIEKIQGNENQFIKADCVQKGWYHP